MQSSPPGSLILILLGILGPVTWAQEGAELEPSDERQAALREVMAYLDRMEMQDASDQSLVERMERPLLTFGDKTRDNSNGTVWAWGKRGRPFVFLEVYRGGDANGDWANAITLTSRKLVALKTSSGASWQPDRPQITPQLIADAPPPDGKGAVRLRQMKDQARRFTAHEFWDPNNSRFELRLLVQPVLRYSDTAAGVQDGAAFVLAHGTNPEIVLLVESLGERSELARWHFSAARLGSAELHLELDGKEVWKQGRTPGVVGKPSDPYWLFMAKP